MVLGVYNYGATHKMLIPHIKLWQLIVKYMLPKVKSGKCRLHLFPVFFQEIRKFLKSVNFINDAAVFKIAE